MARILAAVAPYAGHALPMSGVVAALRDRGHEVVVYAADPWRSRFERIGASTLAWGAVAPPEVPATGMDDLLDREIERIAEPQSRELAAAHAERPFDLVVVDVIALGAARFARAAGLPWATVSPIPLVLAGRHAEALYSPWLVIGAGARSLETPRPGLDDRFRLVGRLAPADAFDDDAATPSWWPDARLAGLPIVLVTQGTVSTDPRELIVPAIEALGGRALTVLATTSGARLPSGLAEPRNVWLADRIPFGRVLPFASAMVTNGGWGAALEALEHGVPLVVAGADLDKPEGAARVARAGAGVDLRTGRPTAGAIAAGVHSVLAMPRYRIRAREVAEELRSLGGAARAAELVEGLLPR